ncbi:hypothetical protein FRC15_008430 [Serendipita sp. 397]|nr:hypothetical protein FRC15_008430 [Serendipita sp. 397]
MAREPKAYELKVKEYVKAYASGGSQSNSEEHTDEKKQDGEEEEEEEDHVMSDVSLSDEEDDA